MTNICERCGREMEPGTTACPVCDAQAPVPAPEAPAAPQEGPPPADAHAAGSQPQAVAEEEEPVRPPPLEPEVMPPDAGPTALQVVLTGADARGRAGNRIGLLLCIALVIGAVVAAILYVNSRSDTSKLLLRLHSSDKVSGQLLRTLAEEYLKQKKGVRQPETFMNGEAVNDSVELKDGDVLSVRGYLPDGTSLREIVIAACDDDDTAIQHLERAECDVAVTLKPAATNATPNLLGLDGLAIIVNQANTVRKLSRENIVEIFSGATTDWTDLRSPRDRIHVYTPKENSEEYQSFKSLVMSGREMVSGENCESAGPGPGCDSGPVVALKVAQDPAGIGFVEFSQVGNARPVAVFDTDQNAAYAPNDETIAREQYPLFHRIFLYEVSRRKQPEVSDFVEWALNRGQEFVHRSGFTKSVPLPANTPAPPDESDKRARATKGAKQLPESDILFQSKTANFADEVQARAVINEVVAMLNAQEYRGPKNIILLGYADIERGANLSLSRQRAKVVEREFNARGFRPAFVEGFGDEYPVDKSNTPEAYAKNRRVEIWLKP